MKIWQISTEKQALDQAQHAKINGCSAACLHKALNRRRNFSSCDISPHDGAARASELRNRLR
jgi:hypothetical protein